MGDVGVTSISSNGAFIAFTGSSTANGDISPDVAYIESTKTGKFDKLPAQPGLTAYDAILSADGNKLIVLSQARNDSSEYFSAIALASIPDKQYMGPE